MKPPKPQKIYTNNKNLKTGTIKLKNSCLVQNNYPIDPNIFNHPVQY